jgi:hypothetical protein
MGLHGLLQGYLYLIIRVKLKEVGQNLYQRHFVHYKSDTKSAGIELEPPRREDST